MAQPGHHHSAAQLVDKFGVRIMFHDGDCNYGYHKCANHSFDWACNPAYMESLEHRIKRLREAKGLSQQAVASKIGVSRVAVTKWESGMTANLKLANLLALCDVFGISVEELVRGAAPNSKASQGVPSPRATFANALPAMNDQTRAAIEVLLLPQEERDALDDDLKVALKFFESQAVRAVRVRKNGRAA